MLDLLDTNSECHFTGSQTSHSLLSMARTLIMSCEMMVMGLELEILPSGGIYRGTGHDGEGLGPGKVPAASD